MTRATPDAPDTVGLPSSSAGQTRPVRHALLSTILRPDPAHVSDNDLGYYLGFFGPGPWVLFLLALPMTVYEPLFVTGIENVPPLSLVALVLLVVGYVLIAMPSATPLPMWRTVVVLAIVTFSLVAVVWPQPYHGELSSAAGWQMSPCDLLLCCLVLRGRYVAAWAGQAIFQLVYASWTFWHAGEPLTGLSFSYGQAMPLAAVTVFAFGLHYTARRLSVHRAAERERAAREAQVTVAANQRETGLREVRQLAGPTLQAIASGQKPDKGAVRGLEAALRDLIRGRNLVREPLVSVLRTAREHGDDIVVLDDTGEADLDRTDAEKVAHWAAHMVQEACSDGREDGAEPAYTTSSNSSATTGTGSDSAATTGTGTRSGHDMTLRLTLEGGRPHITLTVDGNLVGHFRPDSAGLDDNDNSEGTGGRGYPGDSGDRGDRVGKSITHPGKVT